MNPINIAKRAWWAFLRTVRGNRYKHLFQEIDAIKPLNIMEIGTWNGKNALKMITAASKHNPANRINYYSFDLFEEMTDEMYLKEVSKRPPTMDAVQAMLDKTGATIHLYKGDTNKTLPDVLPHLPIMDLIFIDGGHSIKTIANDWVQISKHMGDSTVVIFDDYWENRNDAGCKTIIDSIDKDSCHVNVLPTIDRYKNHDFGKLSIQLARVTRNNNMSSVRTTISSS